MGGAQPEKEETILTFLDASVIVAAILSPTGGSFRILQEAPARGFTLVISPHAVGETRRNILRRYPESITLKSDALPDHIRDVSDSITSEIVGCAHAGQCRDQCALGFKVTPQELGFYRKMNLPLPRLCFACRHGERLRQRNPFSLRHRRCMCAGRTSDRERYRNNAAHFHANDHCPNEFETTYSPEKENIVYCEACYQSEVV